MKFYGRKAELEMLEKSRGVARSACSQMCVITGRRRVGKTKLILRSLEGTPSVYWYVSRANEAMLVASFSEAVRRSLQVFVPEGIRSFPELFEYMMVLGKTRSFSLVIDECQELLQVNPAVFSLIRDIWDRCKEDSRVFLVLSGSAYTMMKRLFEDYREPLFGRASQIYRLPPFGTGELKEILSERHPGHTPDDLLALYAFTGGVPMYVEAFMDAGSVTKDAMIEQMTARGSFFLSEGQNLLISEFGREYGTYFSILAAIAEGATEAPRISEALGGASIGNHLARLAEVYELIEKRRPIFASPGSQTVRWGIRDPFLRFWFRFMYKHRDLLEMNRPETVAAYIRRDYEVFSGMALEDFFRSKLRESGRFSAVSSWWDGRSGKNPSEIDIVAVDDLSKRAFVAEVKRNKKSFREGKFLDKVEQLEKKVLQKRGFTLSPAPCCLTLEDL